MLCEGGCLVVNPGKKLLQNTALLTISSIVMRCIALLFQIWIAGRIGSAGVGLFQLVMSVDVLASTVAISGIRFATTRLVSEEVGLDRPGGVGQIMRRCTGYSLFFGIAAMLILLLCAEPIGFLWVGDARTVLSLQLCSLGMPPLALSSVIAGYFTAMGRVCKTAAAQLAEQLLRIALVMLFLAQTPPWDLEKCCACVVAGGVAADWLGLVLLSFLYAADWRRHGKKGVFSPHLTPRMLRIALPLALSAYARTSLSTFQQLLVPRGLRSAGLSADSALSGYGIIQGMVFPIISFPSCLLQALAELLVPALTEAQVSGRSRQIRAMVRKLLRRCALFSLTAGLILFFAAEPLGMLVYHSHEAGRYIRLFAPLVPILYMDIITDGCLKGLGQMMRSMAYNIAEAMLGILLVLSLLPRYALTGYIAVLYVCELFNFSLSMHRLYTVALKAFDSTRGQE